MSAVHFWGQERGLPVGWEWMNEWMNVYFPLVHILLWMRKHVITALGWNMDSLFDHIQTENAAYSLLLQYRNTGETDDIHGKKWIDINVSKVTGLDLGSVIN